MFMQRVRKASPASAASVALVTSNPSAVTIWKIHQQTQIWLISSIRSVPGVGSVDRERHSHSGRVLGEEA